MVTNELVTTVQQLFLQGKRRNEIKEELINQGYYEEDIDDAIASIQHDAFKQLPVISWVYQLIDRFESKSSLATPHMTLLLMIACVGSLIVLGAGLYFIFDPLGTRSAARDNQRQIEASVIQRVLAVYYQKYHAYPSSLNSLVPEYLQSLPNDDPQTKGSYSYTPMDGNANYQFCTTYELQTTQCFTAQPETPAIPVVPTDTPVPTFSAQPASSTGSETIQ